MKVNGSVRWQKYSTEVDVNGENKESKTGEKTTAINGISIDTLGSKTIIKFSESNKRFTDFVLNALRKQDKFPWNRTYQGSNITTRISGLEDSEIKEIKDLIEKTIRLQLESEA